MEGLTTAISAIGEQLLGSACQATVFTYRTRGGRVDLHMLYIPFGACPCLFYWVFCPMCQVCQDKHGRRVLSCKRNLPSSSFSDATRRTRPCWLAVALGMRSCHTSSAIITERNKTKEQERKWPPVNKCPSRDGGDLGKILADLFVYMRS